jgi:hypothetical protein
MALAREPSTTLLCVREWLVLCHHPLANLNPFIAEESSPATYVTIAAISSTLAKRFNKDDSVLEELFLGLSPLPIRDALRHSNLRRLGHPIMHHFHWNLHRQFARDEKNTAQFFFGIPAK